ncbi:MAG: PaaI family thioesterase [Pseudomonadota bacterium]
MTQWTKESLQAELDACPAILFLKLQVKDLDVQKTSLTLTMPLQEAVERAPGTGQFHGGPVASLIDTAGDYAVALGVGGGVPTMNFRVDYLRPCTGALLRAVATARRVGRTVSVADVDVFNQEGKLCAVGRGSYMSAIG